MTARISPWKISRSHNCSSIRLACAQKHTRITRRLLSTENSPIKILALESSADDTCAAIVDSDRKIYSNVVMKQDDLLGNIILPQLDSSGADCGILDLKQSSEVYILTMRHPGISTIWSATSLPCSFKCSFADACSSREKPFDNVWTKRIWMCRKCTLSHTREDQECLHA